MNRPTADDRFILGCRALVAAVELAAAKHDRSEDLPVKRLLAQATYADLVAAWSRPTAQSQVP